MMDIGCFLLFAVATMLLAIVALVIGRANVERLRRLEARLDELVLMQQSRAGDQGAATVPATPVAGQAPGGSAVTPPPAAPIPRLAPAQTAGTEPAVPAARAPEVSPGSETAPNAVATVHPQGADRPVAWYAPAAATGPAEAAGPLAPTEIAPVPAAAVPAPPASPAPPSAPPSRVDWERWLGLRGAAVIGAVVLALAGVLFLKYSIEHGLFPPAARVAAAMVTGALALAGSEVLRRRGYRPTADGLAGAAVVILYAAAWAAHSLYGLIGGLPTFALMALVTLTAGLLAWRHRALVIASLGLAGGFAAPLLLGTQQDHPLGLFGYLLLLDVGLVVLARRRGWPVVAAVALGATALYELRWLSVEMDAPRIALGLLIVAGFGALFALSGSGDRSGLGWRLSRAGGVLLPAAFALLFAARADLGPHLWPVAAMIALVGLAASWLDRQEEGWRLAPAVAGAAVVTVGVWALRAGYATDRAWELTAIAVVLALIFRLPAEIERRRARPEQPPDDPRGSGTGAAVAAAGGQGIADVLAAAGMLGVLALAPAFHAVLSGLATPLAAQLESGSPAAPLIAWLTGWLALGGLLWHLAADRGREWLHYAAAGGVGIGLALASVAGAGGSDVRRAVVAGLVVAAGFSALALLRHRRGLRRPAEGAAIGVAGLPLLALIAAPARYELSAPWALGAALLFGLLGLLAATRRPSGLGYAGVAAALFLVQASGSAAFANLGEPPDAATVVVFLAAGALLCTLWPALAGSALADRRAAWIAAALAQPVWFFPLYFWWERAFGLGAIALLPLAQGGAALGAAFAARRLWPPGSEQRRSALAWFGAVALGFGALAVPLQLDREWITVAWALQGLAVIALWRRLDHPGLRLFGLALLALATVRLVVNPVLLTYHEASGRLLLSWLTYTYLVPAAALLQAAQWLRRPEDEERDEDDEEAEDEAEHWARAARAEEGRQAAAACGLAAVAVVFVWLNLAIFDAFSQPGGPIQVSLERQPARDLSLSFGWAVYALTLLGLGIANFHAGLRKLGLGFLILTLCKVFLYDLGELEDLYRVASLVGLAVSLLLVSFAYQRFLREEERPDADDDVDPGSGGALAEADEILAGETSASEAPASEPAAGATHASDSTPERPGG